KGFVTFGQTSFEDGYNLGKKSGENLMFHLTIRTEDVDRLLESPEHEAEAAGYIQCERLGGRRWVDKRTFRLLIDSGDRNRKKMCYRLFFCGPEGQPLTLSGFKAVQDNAGPDIWKDTTTLFTNVFSGHLTEAAEASAEVSASGILRIEPL